MYLFSYSLPGAVYSLCFFLPIIKCLCKCCLGSLAPLPIPLSPSVFWNCCLGAHHDISGSSFPEHSSILLSLELAATFDTTDRSVLTTSCFPSGTLPPLTLLAIPQSVSEFFLLSLNFESACFYVLPFSFSPLPRQTYLHPYFFPPAT